MCPPVGFFSALSGLVLFIGDMFHPGDGLAIELFAMAAA